MGIFVVAVVVDCVHDVVMIPLEGLEFSVILALA
jgi:hypothetical protein